MTSNYCETRNIIVRTERIGIALVGLIALAAVAGLYWQAFVLAACMIILVGMWLQPINMLYRNSNFDERDRLLHTANPDTIRHLAQCLGIVFLGSILLWPIGRLLGNVPENEAGNAAIIAPLLVVAGFELLRRRLWSLTEPRSTVVVRLQDRRRLDLILSILVSVGVAMFLAWPSF